MTMTFTGTDVLGQDDLTASPWVTALTTVALDDATGGPFGFASYSLTVDSDGSSRALNGNNRSVADEDYHGFVWVKAGTTDNFEAGLNNGGFNVSAAEIQHGPGSVSVVSSRAAVSGLSTTAWTLVRYTTDAAGASSAADFLIYPSGVAGQTAGDSILLGPQRLAPASESPGWNIGDGSAAAMLTRRRLIGA